MTDIGRRMKEVREAAGLSQAQVARVLGISKQAVNNWELGRSQPMMSSLESFAKVMGVDVGEFFTTPRDPAGRVLTRHDLIVPLIKIHDVRAYLSGDQSVIVQHVVARFQHGPRAFEIVVGDDANAPRYQKGDVLVLDPDVEPAPGNDVMALVAGRVVIGRYRPPSTSEPGRITPYNQDYPPHVMDGPSVLAVIREHARRVN